MSTGISFTKREVFVSVTPLTSMLLSSTEVSFSGDEI
jgi:hypothetical protein